MMAGLLLAGFFFGLFGILYREITSLFMDRIDFQAIYEIDKGCMKPGGKSSWLPKRGLPSYIRGFLIRLILYFPVALQFTPFLEAQPLISAALLVSWISQLCWNSAFVLAIWVLFAVTLLVAFILTLIDRCINRPKQQET